MVANGRKRSQMVANDRKRSQTVANSRKWSLAITNSREPSQTTANGRKRSQTIANGCKPSQTIANGRKRLQMVTKILLYFSLLICSYVRSLRLSCRRSNTWRGPNVGLLLAHRLRRWANISPVLDYRVVFDATLNVGQRHRRRANINPPLIQSIVTLTPACMHPQHEVLIRTECLLARTGDAGPTFNRNWVGVGL